jgi:hypothetical protein
MPGLIIKNATLLDVEAAELRPGASIRIEEDVIAEVAEDGRAITAGADVPPDRCACACGDHHR